MQQLAVIFDVDGVLVDSYQAHFRSWRQMLAEQGSRFTEDQFRSTFGRRSEDIIAALYHGQLSAQAIAELDDRKEALYRDILREHFPAIDGAVELIDALADAGCTLAVGSSGPAANVALTLQCLGRLDKFDALVTRADVTRGKPDPQVFQMAAEKLGMAPERCAVVEDAPLGIEAANRAGMTSIGLTGTASRDELGHADLVVDTLRELTPEAFESLIATH